MRGFDLHRPAIQLEPQLRGVLEAGEFRLITLEALVRMKLSAFRDKDRVHLRDLLGAGLIDAGWFDRVPESLRDRLETILNSPEG